MQNTQVQIPPHLSSSSMLNQFYSVVVYFVPQDIQKDDVTFAEKQPLSPQMTLTGCRYINFPFITNYYYATC